MTERKTLKDIKEEAVRVYGSNISIKFERDGLEGIYLQVAIKHSSIQKNSIAVWSWYEQQAIEAVHAALVALPSCK